MTSFLWAAVSHVIQRYWTPLHSYCDNHKVYLNAVTVGLFKCSGNGGCSCPPHHHHHYLLHHHLLNLCPITTLFIVFIISIFFFLTRLYWPWSKLISALIGNITFRKTKCFLLLHMSFQTFYSEIIAFPDRTPLFCSLRGNCCSHCHVERLPGSCE